MTLRRVPPVYAPLRPFSALVSGGGDPRARLERRLRARLHADAVVLTGSGTQALRLAVRAALGLVGGAGGAPAPRGAVVAMPAFTCYDVAAAVLAEVGRVTCFDIDPHTLAPVPESLERALSIGAQVLVVSPLYGIPVPWGPIAAAAAAAGAVLVEDAAQGHGAAWRGRPLGAVGDISVISFARGKGWSGGSGGAVLVRGGARGALRGLAEPERPGPAAAVASGLAALAQWSFGRTALYGAPAALPWLGLGETVYRPAPDPAAMPAPAARLALASEAAADAEAAARRRRGAWFRRRLPAEALVRAPDGGLAGELRLPVRIPGGASALPPEAARLGVADTYPESLPALPAVRSALVDREARW